MSEFRRSLMMQGKEDNPILKDYLTIVALEDGLTAKLSLNACEYCVDGDGNWKTLPTDTETETINAGHTLSFRGNLTPKLDKGIGTFTVNKFHNLKGNCMSMLFGDDAKDCFSLARKSYAFYNLFKENDKLINVSKLFLPATGLIAYCYYGMFDGCVNLQSPPDLPAEVIIRYCYRGMFQNCKSLLSSPILQGKKLEYGSYGSMFSGCTKLNTITMLATDISADYCLANWVNGVASNGTFIKSKDATWNVTGASGIPFGWEVITE